MKIMRIEQNKIFFDFETLEIRIFNNLINNNIPSSPLYNWFILFKPIRSPLRDERHYD